MIPILQNNSVCFMCKKEIIVSRTTGFIIGDRAVHVRCFDDIPKKVWNRIKKTVEASGQP